MSNLGIVWELRKDDTLLGTLTLKDQDMFWFACDFVPTPAFEPYCALFAQEAQLLDDLNPFETLYAQIGELNLALHINNEFDNENVFWLHILENEASFRPLKNPRIGGWVDKPMDNTE